MATIKEWFQGIAPKVFYLPKTAKNDYNSQEWSDLPFGTWDWKNVPEEILNLEFNSSLGSKHVPDFIAWTKDKVYYVCKYDGACWLDYVPRNPQDIE